MSLPNDQATSRTQSRALEIDPKANNCLDFRKINLLSRAAKVMIRILSKANLKQEREESEIISFVLEEQWEHCSSHAE